MREIKFRVFDGINMVYPDWIAIVDSGKNWQTKPNANYKTDDNPLMQFTGLKDKNGTEIYEGDLVRAWSKTEWGSRAWSLAEVQWYDGEGMWTFCIHEHENGEEVGSESWGAIKFKFEDGLDVEVIGNIYENPDLLV